MAEVLGWQIVEDEDEVALQPAAASAESGVLPDLLFLRAPEGKPVKNRPHLALRPGDQAAEVPATAAPSPLPAQPPDGQFRTRPIQRGVRAQ